MIFLAITVRGLQEALRLSECEPFTIWCGADAISDSDYEALQGRNVSRFTYALGDGAVDVLAGAIETIKEHHPDETVWIERIFK